MPSKPKYAIIGRNPQCKGDFSRFFYSWAIKSPRKNQYALGVVSFLRTWAQKKKIWKNQTKASNRMVNNTMPVLLILLPGPDLILKSLFSHDEVGILQPLNSIGFFFATLNKTSCWTFILGVMPLSFMVLSFKDF